MTPGIGLRHQCDGHRVDRNAPELIALRWLFREFVLLILRAQVDNFLQSDLLAIRQLGHNADGMPPGTDRDALAHPAIFVVGKDSFMPGASASHTKRLSMDETTRGSMVR